MEKGRIKIFNRSLSLKQRTRIAANISMLPSIIILAVTFVIPIGYAFYLSFRKYNLAMGNILLEGRIV